MTHSPPSRIPAHITLNAHVIQCTRGTQAAARFLHAHGFPLAAAKRILLLPARKVRS